MFLFLIIQILSLIHCVRVISNDLILSDNTYYFYLRFAQIDEPKPILIHVREYSTN